MIDRLGIVLIVLLVVLIILLIRCYINRERRYEVEYAMV